MTMSTWRGWLRNRIGQDPRGVIARRRQKRRALALEGLEPRIAMSLTPQMVLDINVNTFSSSPSGGVVIGSDFFFVADDGVHGKELWKSDGSVAGTQLVKDINAGGGSSDPSQFTAVNGMLFFSAYDPVAGRELWKSDGTPAGTIRVKDIAPGPAFSGPGWLTNVGGTLYFSAFTEDQGYELWRSDGTEGGTFLVQDIWPGSGNSSPGSLTDVNGTLFFVADNGASGYELWKSNGTASGTTLVKNIASGASSSYPTYLTNLNGSVYFSARTGSSGAELWKSNGTASGTVMVKDILAGSGGSYPGRFAALNGKLYFAATDNKGTELWTTDGSAGGTVRIADINPGFSGSYPRALTNVNGTLFFSASDGATGFELWKSNGTAAGTQLVKDIFPGHYTWSSNPDWLVNVAGTLYFTAEQAPGARTLWKSDGTAAGTTIVMPAAPAESLANPWPLSDLNGALLFAAESTQHGLELWKSNGTAAGTTLVKDINARGFGSFPGILSTVNGTTFFSANDGIHGGELWKTDGTAGGTLMVKDLNASPSVNSYPASFTDLNGSVFFTARLESYPYSSALWKTDGTAAGTALVSASPQVASGLINLNGTLIFQAYDESRGNELWKSDGTAAGTTLLKDIFPGTTTYYGPYGGLYEIVASSFPRDFTLRNGLLYFTAEDGTHGRELWRTDGTAAGTIRVSDILSGPAGSFPESLTNFNGLLYFSASNGAAGRELWKSDGTAAGTTMVKDLVPGAAGSSPNKLTNVDGTLFFSAFTPDEGWELWKSDGTAAGTSMVADLFPGTYTYSGYYGYWSGPNSSNPWNLTSHDGLLFFAAADGEHGVELWKSDGTAAGTQRVKDLTPGIGNSHPTQFTSVDGNLFFIAYDETYIPKLWTTDGIADGTFIVADMDVNSLANVSGTLFFTADDGIHGRELWRLVDDDTPPPPALTIGDVTLTEGNSGTRSATFIVTLSAASTQTVTVNFTTGDGSATAGSDYTAATGTLSFAPGETSKTISVLVTGDRVGESDETFLVNLSGATNAVIADGQGWGTILDDEPRANITDVTRSEGNSGTTAFVFTVSLSSASDAPVLLNFATANGTAAASSDYTAASGTLSFAPGETSKTITVLIKGDRLGESDETFLVNLSGATNAVIADGQGVGTIIDDEPRITISDVTKAEGNSGTTAFVFTVTLSTPYDVAVTVNFATANGTARASKGDYIASSGTITFAAGQTTQPITISVRGDRKKEPDETFFVKLSDASNALILDNQGIGTIRNDDGGALDFSRFPKRTLGLAAWRRGHPR